MILPLTLLSAAAPAGGELKEVCEVGRVALHDLSIIEKNQDVETFYDVGGPVHTNLLEACPKLRTELPARFPLADDQARARASVHLPVLGAPQRGVFIYQIDIPEISADRKRAVVHFNYTCSGLCGGTTDAHYVRTSTGWKREGGFLPVAVS